MTVTLTMDTTLSRVRVAVDGLGAAVTATVERSTNGITWTTVRGGLDVPVTAGSCAVDDYEFVPGVENTYRVRYADTITYVGAGTADHDDNLPVTPGLPAGLQADDFLVELTAIRNTSGVPQIPTGYTDLWTASNFAARGKTATGSESVPTQAFSGGVAGASTSAQLAAWRGCSPQVGAIQVQVNASAQDIASPGLTPTRDNSVLIYAGWKQDDWTGVTVPGSPAVSEIGEPSTTVGDDQGIVWGYLIQTEATTVGAASFVVTGGAAALSYAVVFELLANEITQSSSITPTLDRPWLKNLGRSFLNRAVTVVDWSDIDHPSRAGVFPIVGRSRAVGVTDVRTMRSYDLTLRFGSVAEAQDFVDTQAVGDPVFLHVPQGCPFPGMYAVVGDVRMSRRQARSTSRYVSLPLIETAAPGPDIVPATATWQTVINTYATWADVIAAHPTWFDLQDLIGQPGEVIIP